MNTRTVSLLLAVCAVGVWAPARAQNADTSVLKLPQDIIYKGLPGAPQHVTLFGKLFPTWPVCRPYQIFAGHEGHAPLAS